MTISIHAPTRGATLHPHLFPPARIFQSTLPREERPSHVFASLFFSSNFNPRSHERSDCLGTLSVHSRKDFNPRSHERSDEIKGGAKEAQKYFNPRSHERSDQCKARFLVSYSDFNPRSHERSDSQHRLFIKNMVISIHAPTRGATAILHKKFVYFYTIPTINI